MLTNYSIEQLGNTDAWYIIDHDNGFKYGPYISREAAQRAIDENRIS